MKKTLFIVFCGLSFVATAQLDIIKERFEAKPRSEETVIWLCDTAYSLYFNDPLLTQQIAELALNEADRLNANLAKAKANHVLGVSYWARDRYEEAIAYYLDAINYYDILGDTRGKALISMNIGTIYDDLGESERGKKYLLDSERLIRSLSDSTNLGKVLNNLAVLYKRLDQQDSSFFYYEQCMTIRKALNDSLGVASLYNNIAIIYIENIDKNDLVTNDAEIAYSNLMSALDYLRSGDDSRLLSTIKSNLGKVLMEMDRLSEAETQLFEAAELASSIDHDARLQMTYAYIKQLYELRSNYRVALEYYEKQIEINEKLRSAEITKQIDELNIKYETAQKEKRLAELERQKAVDQGIKNNLMIGAISVISIAFIIVIYIIQKRRKDKLIAKLEVQHLADEINVKNKEIASYTMSFLQKNQLMEELKEQINELKKSSDVTTNKELTRINRIVDNTFRSDEEWKTFQITFDQMHDGFFTELKKAFPEISNAELKLCALLRLNMNLKESAKILGIAPDSVKTARYRLRKKLGLKTEVNLIDFLLQFEKGQDDKDSQ